MNFRPMIVSSSPQLTLRGTLVLVADHVWIVEVVLDEVLASVRDELLDDEEAVLVLEVPQVLPFQIGLDHVEKGGLSGFPNDI